MYLFLFSFFNSQILPLKLNIIVLLNEDNRNYGLYKN